MTRTVTTNQTTFTRPGSVTYTLYSPPSPSTRNKNPLRATTITLPPGSTWTSGLHWHESHTEYLQILHGAARITLNATTATYTAADGIIVVPAFARHEWQRADAAPAAAAACGEEAWGAELVVREWTDPVDGEKEVFFRNLHGVILDAAARPGSARRRLPGVVSEFWVTLQLFVLFAGLDNYPVLYGGPRWLGFLAPGVEWVVAHVLLRLAAWLGGFLGLRVVYEEYTPRGLWEDYGLKRGLGRGKERTD